MTLIELGSASAVHDFCREHAAAVVTFSAHWCGPCKASKPALQELAEKHAVSSGVKFGIVYESDLGDDIHSFSVRAFPTYVLFQSGTEVKRVEGANLPKVEEMIQGISTASAVLTGGETLGGGGIAPLSPASARAARLAKLDAAVSVSAPPVESATPMEEDEKKEPAAAAAVEAAVEKEAAKDGDGDTEMKDAVEEVVKEDPTAKLDAELIKQLTESMGFTLIRAQKGLLYGNAGTVEGAVEWLMEHQDDVDIDEAIPAQIAQSYKCNECGKLFSNMANLELHANKTGHSDFEESTERVQPLTAEQKAAKIAEIKQLLKSKRSEREEAEKVDETVREIQRRSMGKEVAKTKEQMDIEARKREAYLRKKEKEAFTRERARLREQLASDKAERIAHKGKLTSRLGVDGYKPDAIQYDVPTEGEGKAAAAEGAPVVHKQKKQKADAARIDEYISKVVGYKAGGDGGKCLKILKIYVTNVVDNPDEEKFKSINTESKAYKGKVKPFIGAKNILLACGFVQNEGGDALVLNEDADKDVLAQTKTKLEAAIVAYG